MNGDENEIRLSHRFLVRC